MYVIFVHICCRAPRGARGLKCRAVVAWLSSSQSRPARGAWIEMGRPSFPALTSRSRPARGAWIEIGAQAGQYRCRAVAPREGRVD